MKFKVGDRLVYKASKEVPGSSPSMDGIEILIDIVYENDLYTNTSYCDTNTSYCGKIVKHNAESQGCSWKRLDYMPENRWVLAKKKENPTYKDLMRILEKNENKAF